MALPKWARPLIGVNHILLAINSAMNFVIYCSKDKKFRKAVKKTLLKTPRCCTKVSNWMLDKNR